MLHMANMPRGYLTLFLCCLVTKMLFILGKQIHLNEEPKEVQLIRHFHGKLFFLVENIRHSCQVYKITIHK